MVLRDLSKPFLPPGVSLLTYVLSPARPTQLANNQVNAETPGAIHEGGELGYCLAVAYGSVMDKPNHITVAVIGDGESETGPTAAAWHAHKYLDPKESGAVIPILHVNGYKVSALILQARIV